MGYSNKQKGYRLFDVQSRKLVIRRDVTFSETDFGQQKLSAEIESEDEIDQEVGSEGNGPSEMPPLEDSDEEDQQEVPRRSQRSTKGVPPARLGIDDYTEATHVALRASIEEPATIQEALSSKYSEQWKAAADSEYQSLMENKTWELVELPQNRKAIGCRWVFRVKYDEKGQVERFKGRLVAKGYSQKYGIDYDETFSPVVRFSSIRTLLAFAVQKGMLIHQMDVITAFLNGDLQEEIYMEQPEGYTVPGKEEMVCRLKKSLYGLKQSPRCWNQKFRESMELLQFKQSQADPCIFSKGSEKDKLIIIAVYVDDLIIVTTNQQDMDKIKTSLSENFKMKDMGSLHFCLGFGIEQNEEGIKLSQKLYIQKLLERYGLQEANPVSTPMDPNVKHVAEDGYSKPVDKVRYQSMIGSLLYAAIATRPDISQAVGALSKFNSAPTEAHLTAVKRILRYLKGTINLSLQYKRTESLEIVGYSDADWANDMETRHSTSGNVFVMGEGPISWLSQKQATVALSTAEAEYIALCSAAQEAVWLKQLFKDIGVDITKPLMVMEDNQGAIAMTNNPVGHKRTKHIDIRYHFVREQVQKGTMKLKYCSTKEMLADMLTKPLNKRQFEYLRSKLGLK